MRRTIYVPDELEAKINTYLQEHPDESFSSIVQDALEAKLLKKDISQLIALSGIIKDAPFDSSQNAEDMVIHQQDYIP